MRKMVEKLISLQRREVGSHLSYCADVRFSDGTEGTMCDVKLSELRRRLAKRGFKLTLMGDLGDLANAD